MKLESTIKSEILGLFKKKVVSWSVFSLFLLFSVTIYPVNADQAFSIYLWIGATVGFPVLFYVWYFLMCRGMGTSGVLEVLLDEHSIEVSYFSERKRVSWESVDSIKVERGLYKTLKLSGQVAEIEIDFELLSKNDQKKLMEFVVAQGKF